MSASLLAIKDWRDASAYVFPKDLPGEKWAWEFLRRNKGYQRDFYRLLPAFLRCRKAHLKAHDSPSWRYDYDSNPPEDSEFCINSKLAFKKWRIESFFHPLNDSPTAFGQERHVLNPNQVQAVYGPNVRMQLKENKIFTLNGSKQCEVPDGHIAFFIDPIVPLAPQLKMIERFFANMAQDLEQNADYLVDFPNTFKHHREKWPTYLRCYDASLSRVSRREIASVIFPKLDPDFEGKERYTETLKQAKRMIERDYYTACWEI